MFSRAHAFVRHYVVPLVIGLLCVLAVGVTGALATAATAHAEINPKLVHNHAPSCASDSACRARPAHIR
jgi:hypothetical protein